MHEWEEATQRMIDWIENHLSESSMLASMSRHVGYSPHYCSVRFHEVVGMTVKSYAAGRRLARATLDIRDTDERILDIALKHGYSSQEALTRAFVRAYRRTPAAYRKSPSPIMLPVVQNVLFPAHRIGKGEKTMNENCLTNAKVRVEYIPAHKYIGIWSDSAKGYGEFWTENNCDEVCGIIESMSHVAHPVVGVHMAGWHWMGDKRRYFYGFGVPTVYAGAIPEGFTVRDIPESHYMVFFHPPFDYLKDNDEVMNRVEDMAWTYAIENASMSGQKWTWNEDLCPDYQRHYPEVLG